MIATNALARDTVAVVLAGGMGTRLGALTRHVCKPAVPFGATYRNIDFSLSNCVNSGIFRIGVATQHKPESLLRHLNEVWRDVVSEPDHFISPWRAEDRAPRLGYRGTADAVFRNLEVIESLDSRHVLVLAGDHVYKMDYRPMLEYHSRRGADVTVGSVEVPVEEAHQFGILSVAPTGRINQFIEKPKTLQTLPDARGHVLASMGIYVFDTEFLAEVLRRDTFSSSSGHDFGGDILPGILQDAGVFAYPFRGPAGDESAYWRDVGTPAAYWRAHMELLGPSPLLRLDDPSWPLMRGGEGSRLTPCDSVSGHTGSIEDSLVADDCVIRGIVRRSVLFSGVTISEGADVKDTVVLPGAVIGKHCRLRGAIVDSGCRIPDGMIIDQSSSATFLSNHSEPVVVTVEDLSEVRSLAAHG